MCRCHYGWVMLGVFCLGSLSATMGQGVSISTYQAAFGSELNAKPWSMCVGWAAGQVVAALLLPYVGLFVDRRGSKVLAWLLVPLAGVALVTLAAANHVWLLMPALALTRVVVFETNVFLCSNVLSRWFVARRGAVSGFVNTIEFLYLLYPTLSYSMQEAFGYRLALVCSAAGTSTMLAVNAVLWVHQPNDLGLQPDLGKALPNGDGPLEDLPAKGVTVIGASDWTQQPTGGTPCAAVEFTKAMALRTCMFWSLSVHNMLLMGCYASFFMNSNGFLEEAGISTAQQKWIFPIASAIHLFSSPVIGAVVVDRLARGVHLLNAVTGLLVVTVCVLTSWAVVVSPPLQICVFGTLIGLWFPLHNVIFICNAQIFGVAHLGEIDGVAASFRLVGGAAALGIVGFSHLWLGTYAPAFCVFAVLLAVSSSFLLLQRAPMMPSEG